MSVKINGPDDTCRTCLARFEVIGEKFALINCSAIKFDENRLQMIKNIMTACSLTLFNDEDISTIHICASCVQEIERILTFIDQCTRAEQFLKNTLQVKLEVISTITTWNPPREEESKENALPLKSEITIKTEDSSYDVNEYDSGDADDLPLSYLTTRNNNEAQVRHTCEECNKTFRSALSLINHQYKHTGNMPHTCPVCKESFRSLARIQKHMEAKHDGARYKPFVCRFCTDVFTSRYHLNRHEQLKHNSKGVKLNRKVFPCATCKRTFTTVSSLKFHQNVHLGVRPYSCSTCSKTFRSAFTLKDHTTNMHSKIKPFVCHCGKSYNRKKKLEFHVNTVHEKKDKFLKYKCNTCDKRFLHPYSLKNHLNVHLGVKPFLCNACGASFASPSNLRSHFRRIHSGEEKKPSAKIHLCHNCGESFARASHLKRHTLRKHIPNVERKYECPICKKKFLEKSDVTGHIKSHDDSKPFNCSQCSKCFRTNWSLQAHVNRVHLGLRPFECPTCSVKFKTKSHLEKHIRTHTGEKPFPCPHCAYTCAEKSNLKKHINIHLKSR